MTVAVNAAAASRWGLLAGGVAAIAVSGWSSGVSAPVHGWPSKGRLSTQRPPGKGTDDDEERDRAASPSDASIPGIMAQQLEISATLWLDGGELRARPASVTTQTL